MTEPDWRLLPSRPQQFFGLSGEFDRKELKRAYNHWIRQFKPEKFPLEFQRIRAAFEQLESELRYGPSITIANAPIQEYVWQAHAEASPVGADSGISAPPSHSIGDRLKTESPAVVYRSLMNKAKKTPYEFFVLATLADVVTQDTNLYFKWLLTGLKTHQNDPGLFQLLQQFFRRDIKPELLKTLLLTTSKVVNNDRFYLLTEKCWLRLVGQIDFSTFKKLLANCESNLNDHRNQSQFVFYTELLKAAIWVGDEAWLAQKFSLIEGGQRETLPELGMDLDLLDMLKEYQVNASEIVQDNPIRKRIHDAIKDYFVLDQTEADLKIVECQTCLVSEAQALLDAFPDESEGVSVMMILWTLVNEDVSERHGLTVGVSASNRKEQKRFFDRVNRLLQDLDETWQLGARHIMTYYLLMWGSYFLIAVTPIILLSSWLHRMDVMMACGVLVVAGIVLNFFYLVPKTILPIFHRYIEREVHRNYQQLWRGRFVQLFDATGATMSDLIPVLYNLVERGERFHSTTTWIPPLVQSDIGLAFYSLAARYRR